MILSFSDVEQKSNKHMVMGEDWSGILTDACPNVAGVTHYLQWRDIRGKIHWQFFKGADRVEQFLDELDMTGGLSEHVRFV